MSLEISGPTTFFTGDRFRPDFHLMIWDNHADDPVVRIPLSTQRLSGALTIPEKAIQFRREDGKVKADGAFASRGEQQFHQQYLSEITRDAVLQCVAQAAGITAVIYSLNEGKTFGVELIPDATHHEQSSKLHVAAGGLALFAQLNNEYRPTPILVTPRSEATSKVA
jgi:hypothetical protein